MTTGARFCHRCGSPAGTTGATATRGVASALPWTVAAIALVALIALVVGQRFGRQPDPANDIATGSNAQPDAPFASAGGAMPRAPDISQLTPEQRAERLFERVMREHEAGQAANVRTFFPMARGAYEQLDSLTLDQRYDLGRLGEVAGDPALARAQSDTILSRRPTHLLGLALGARVARAAGDEPHARQFETRLLAVEARERAAALPEYLLHRTDIDAAIALARSSAK
jgi:hypothetical protein